ncbi:MAG TPA: hypothetical protein VMI15_07575 [Burkholderiales bacterium]|nr:hypothetical protein [Burkholderiales bacterium]
MRDWPTLLLLLAVAFAAFMLAPFRAPGAKAAASETAQEAPAPRARPEPAPAPQSAPAAQQAAQQAASARFGGYPCDAASCPRYRAGFSWAAAREISDPDACTGKTWQFIEGCRVYAYGRAAAG